MYILAIETTGAFASVALAKAEGTRCDILSHVHGHDRFSHLQNLTPQINEVLTEAALSIDDIGAIAVSHGPGSFTGIRIGVSTARALAQAKDITCVPVADRQVVLRIDGPLALEDAPAIFDERVVVVITRPFPVCNSSAFMHVTCVGGQEVIEEIVPEFVC